MDRIYFNFHVRVGAGLVLALTVFGRMWLKRDQ